MDCQFVGGGGNDVRSDGVPVGFSMQSGLSMQLVRAEGTSLKHLGQAAGSTTSGSSGNGSGGLHSTTGARNGLPGSGLVVQGSEVTIRTVSGRPVLAMTTEKYQAMFELIAYCRSTCAASENVPEVCVDLRWKPPVRIQCPGECYPISLEATLSFKRIPSDGPAFLEGHPAPHERCVVCYDAVGDVDIVGIDRAENCERCRPSVLCDNCKVMIGECNAVCLQCLSPQEIPIFSETQAFRRSLVFHSEDTR